MQESTLKERLKQAGYKYTTPRRVVWQILEASNGHLSANEIWELVQSVDAQVGRMSVYRTLDLFTRIGYIHPAPQSTPDARNGIIYVVMKNGHHHHIICKQCNRIIEFEECGLEDLIQRLENQHHCRISGHLLELYATCQDCLTAPDHYQEI